MDTITLDPEEEVRIGFEGGPMTLFWCRIIRKLHDVVVRLWKLMSDCEVHSLQQDVDLVHCRIGKIEGLEVLQKAKVSVLLDPQGPTTLGSFMTCCTEQQSFNNDPFRGVHTLIEGPPVLLADAVLTPEPH